MGLVVGIRGNTLLGRRATFSGSAEDAVDYLARLHPLIDSYQVCIGPLDTVTRFLEKEADFDSATVSKRQAMANVRMYMRSPPTAELML